MALYCIKINCRSGDAINPNIQKVRCYGSKEEPFLYRVCRLTCHVHLHQQSSEQIECGLAMRVQSMLNHIRFVFYHNINAKENVFFRS